ncbi:MAG TPA: catalase family peroxidase [Advenella sp.]|nr:catalase family peroxidase [Advenella sp.]
MLEKKQIRPSAMTVGQKLMRLAVIGAAVAGLGAAFGYTAGWLGPQRLTADRIANTFEPGGKTHPGFRRNHAKGICVTGRFESSGQAQNLSRAPLFAADTNTPLVGRLALPGPNPYAPDASVPIRSFALRFTMPDGQQWRTGMNSMPVFPVATPQSFYEQQLAGAPDPKTGKPDPDRIKAFFASHPETARFREWVKTARPSASFATETYYSLNAFVFINNDGVRQNVRWRVAPLGNPVADEAAPEHDQNYLDKDLNRRLSAGPLRWRLIVTVADPGDPSNDATKPWPDSRKQVDAGTIVIEKSQSQDHGPCRDINFDPTVLPQGMAISDDPLLPARSSVYAASVDRRTREGLSRPSPSPSSSAASSEHSK